MQGIRWMTALWAATILLGACSSSTKPAPQKDTRELTSWYDDQASDEMTRLLPSLLGDAVTKFGQRLGDGDLDTGDACFEIGQEIQNLKAIGAAPDSTVDAEMRRLRRLVNGADQACRDQDFAVAKNDASQAVDQAGAVVQAYLDQTS